MGPTEALKYTDNLILFDGELGLNYLLHLDPQTVVHNGKIHIDQALTLIYLFTILKTTSYVIQGLTLLTESLVLWNLVAVICPSILIPVSRDLYYSNFWDP